jgi:lysylphosphatidylglycerol synthetase-like protein (DUF2156 family)
VDKVPFTAVEKLARRLVTALSPFFQIRSLQRFNVKFASEWLPRILAFRRPADRPSVGRAARLARRILKVWRWLSPGLTSPILDGDSQ